MPGQHGTSLLDDFNRANGAPGASWSSPSIATYGAYTIVSNQLDGATTFLDSYWNTSFSGNQEAWVTIKSLPTSGYTASLQARIQSPNTGTHNFYNLLIDTDGVGLHIQKELAGVSSHLQNTATTVAVNDVIGLVCIGSTIQAFKNGSQVGTDQTDATISGAGYIGLRHTNTTAVAWDDFGGGATPGPQFDAVSEFERTLTTDPQTWTHTTSASPKGVVVAVVHGTSSTDHVSTITYGGVSMGEVVRAVDTTTEAGAAELWFLGSGIPTGNQTVSVDLASATTDDIHFMCFTVAGTANTEVIDFDSLQAENANPTVVMSKGGRLGWSVAAMYGGGSAPGGTLSAGNTLGPIFDLGVFYSQSCYETTVDASDHTIGWSTLGADDLAFVALCLAEVVTVSFVPRITSYVS